MKEEAALPPDERITYVTMSAGRQDEIHRALDAATDRVRHEFGDSHGHLIGGERVVSAGHFETVCPHDNRILVGRFSEATAVEVEAAVAVARAAAPSWAALPWAERLASVRGISEEIRKNRWDLAALMGYEAGKNRLECLGDVEETADLIDYYCDQIEAHDGFVTPMSTLGPNEENVSVLRPYGVWAVIAPFNFPLALAGGPAGAALATGNTVILKPASATPLLGLKLAELAARSGLPAGVFNVVTGGGAIAGDTLANSLGIDGVVFTGSKRVGLALMRRNAERSIPRPLVAEMGGKNAALVMTSADLDEAAEGVMRSAFGAQGQKCSACSRVYVARERKEAFVKLLAEKTSGITIGDPLSRDVWMGPLINGKAVATFERAVEEAHRDGGKVVTGGLRLTDGGYGHGHFVQPTVIEGLPPDHRLLAEELFVPITVVCPIDSLEEGLVLANATEYGLTAGIFSREEREIATFFEGIQAGVTYANRRANATAGAWPGVNPFGGWKASGSSGRGSGGPYYVQQFQREQSRVRVWGED